MLLTSRSTSWCAVRFSAVKSQLIPGFVPSKCADMLVRRGLKSGAAEREWSMSALSTSNFPFVFRLVDRAQQSRDRVGLFKELDRQDRSQAPEDIEVVPFDDVSHRRGDDHAPEVLRNLRASHSCSLLFLRLYLQGFIASRHAVPA